MKRKRKREETKKGRRKEKEEKKRRREKKGGEKLHRESNPRPLASTLTVDRPRLMIACTYYTDIYRESRL